MQKIFLKDVEAGWDLTYPELLKEITSANAFIPYLKTTSLSRFYINLLTGLASGNEVVLLDSDFSESEVEKLLGSAEVMNEQKEVHVEAENIEQLLSSIDSNGGTLSLFTSGTTGLPKKVTHAICNFIRGVRRTEGHSNNVWALAYNPTHMAGLQVFFQALYNVNSLVNIFGKSKPDIFNAIEDLKITHLSATPTFFRMLLPAENIYNSVVRITFGGEKSDENLHNKIRYLFPKAKINNIYASTEAGAILSASKDEFEIKKEVIGKVQIRDNEILIHSSLLGDSAELKLDGEWYHTNDIVELTSINPLRFKIVSRKNELINVGGYKVNPNEVEENIMMIEGIMCCRVYGKPNSVLGKILCAEFIPQNGLEITKQDIKKNLDNKLQNYKIPRIIKRVEQIELTRTGKIKR